MKVLTIDFDIIMGADIDKYNNKVPQMTWNELMRDPHMSLLRANFDIYSELTIWLQSQFNKMRADQIYFIKDHQSVNKIIGDETHCNLINIDHHHDVGYAPSPEKDRKLTCGNWVRKLMDNEQLDSYIWVNNETSYYPDNEDFNCSYDVQSVETPFLLRQHTDCDKLIICLSPEWVPPYYQTLYWLWIQMYEQHYGKKIDII